MRSGGDTFVHQPERERLVAHQSLVVALRIRDRGLLVPAGGEAAARLPRPANRRSVRVWAILPMSQSSSRLVFMSSIHLSGMPMPRR